MRIREEVITTSEEEVVHQLMNTGAKAYLGSQVL